MVASFADQADPIACHGITRFNRALAENIDSKGDRDQLFWTLRHGGGGRRSRRFARRRTTMIIIGIILSFVGLAYLCWLLFALAVYALPFFAAVTVGLTAYHSGSGSIAAIAIGAITGSVVVILAQTAVTRSRSRLMRAALALLFAVPAAVAGYHAARGLAHLVVPAETWRDAIAIAGATIVAATASMRMLLFPPPDAGQGRSAGRPSPHLPTSQTSEA
jgi:hypothetical protein